MNAEANHRRLRVQQQQAYARQHQDSVNLALHLLAVPAFMLANLGLLLALASGRWRLALAAAGITALSLLVQGLGHGREQQQPAPFEGPLDAARRILVEQWWTFPRFVLSGQWRAALRSRPSRQL